jgi:tetratricopeptide (TPR) repeat protein
LKCTLGVLMLMAAFGLPAVGAHADKIEDGILASTRIEDANAIKLLTEAIEESGQDRPRLARAYFNRGEANAAARHTDDAIADFTMALTLQKDSNEKALILVSRAEAYARKRMDAEAIADYSHSLALEPRQIGVLTARGAAFQRNGDKAAAIKDFNAELQARPKYYKALVGRATILGTAMPPDPETLGHTRLRNE